MGNTQKLTGYQVLNKEGRENDLQFHKECHSSGRGAKCYVCYLIDCDLRPVMMGNTEVLKREVASCTKKEFDILVAKDFLREFSEREKKIILGDKKIE
jgi:hypothetical protein